MMQLKTLCELIHSTPPDDATITVSAVTEDSRRVQVGTLFVAMPGEKVDGHDFARQAAEKGAVAILGGREDLSELEGLPYIYAPNVRHAEGIIAHALVGDPSKAMTVIGITGTNGKSSTAFLTQAILRHAGHTAANFGTIGYEIDGKLLSAAHTTPFPEELADMFRQAKAAEQSHVVMEVSSHALEQDRVAGIDFDVAAFTNLTQDHLDYHLTMEAYCEAKLKLFHRMETDASHTAVNADDPASIHFVAASKVHCHRYGAAGEVRAEQVHMHFGGTDFTLVSPWGKTQVSFKLLGHHNVMNALCAATICGGLGMPIETIAEGLGTLPSVPGRFEVIDEGQEFYVIVDYAHTDDGLKNVLEASRNLCDGRVITVFGCGGDRDTGKRPKMGAVAARLSDFCIVTSDNPRTEDPFKILLDVEVGLQQKKKRKHEDYLVIESREEAIQTAICMAQPGDLVMIAGKGHEDYQILGTEKIHFDDCEVARAVLEDLSE